MKRFSRLFSILLGLATAFFFTDVLAEISCSFKTQRLECGKLACSKTEHICIRCDKDADCYPASMECVHAGGKCRVRTLHKGFSHRTALAMAAGLMVCGIGVVSGVGGGGILVPMYASLMQLPLETAVGISQVTVCGQSVLNVYMSSQRKYVDTVWDRPLINYQYLSLLFPLGLLGTLFGVLNTVLPDVIRLALLFLLLLVVLYRTVLKVLKQYKEDISQKNAVTADRDTSTQLEPREETNSISEAHAVQHISQDQYPIKDLLEYVFYFIVTLISNIVRLYCTCGGAIYWLALIIPALLLWGGFFYTYKTLSDLHHVCPAAITFRWEPKIALYYPLVAIFAGAAGAILGIGGGMILGFILYEIDLIPEEVSVTSNVVTCFIALSSAICALLKGDVPYDFAIVFCVVGIISTLLGNMVFLKEIRKRGLRFIIILCLAFIVAGSLVATGSYGIVDILDKDDKSSIIKIGRICSS